ncbi:probable myosin-binding protein 5 [Malania oleifera]|uniref:probable myosin-binding protein 5 n=1 Tax=Malania oleifera TaxID=397392 RepID=UPI0025ADA2A6|nr:probable myosin-binding protein 5 [Malania oleifera]
MASRSFRRFVEQELGKFPHFVIYAVLEWVLIVMLFIDGFLSFIANELAKFFEMQIPCLLCTRIDHVLVRRNSDFYYNDSVCEAHKKDVSFLAYCHVHRKLSDIRRMCEQCLLSFATGKESDCDTYKSLVGILHKDFECFVEDDHGVNLKLPVGKKDEVVHVEKSSELRCSCCGEPLKMKSSLPRSSVNRSVTNGNHLSHVPAPTPRASFVTLKNEESRSSELPHIQYSELKFMSDNEMTEEEEGSNAFIAAGREDAKAATVPLLAESEYLNEVCKSPNFHRGNKFFGIPLTDSATNSPRWTTRLLRKSPLEKSELASESIEGNSTNEIDCESILHRLKRQVRLDRKSLIALYMELDEERSASAIAANNAMAMITRLQAEKAAVQMEALQYQRMMEEQAEYDEEALQVMKDLLAKREEEMKDLETEIGTYREKYGCNGKVGTEGCDDRAANDYQELHSQSYSSFSEKSECGSPSSSFSEGGNNEENEHNSGRAGSLQEENGRGVLDESILDFEGERLYLFDHLKKLEKRMKTADDGVQSSLSSTDLASHEKEDRGEGTSAFIAREISYLSERLRALEADSGFLKHAAMTIQKGNDGTQLLTEIAQHLQKLRHLEKMTRKDVAA